MKGSVAGHPKAVRASARKMLERCESAAKLCAIAVIALGAVVLTGWVLDVGSLKNLRPTWVMMVPNTALGFVLIGIALSLACSEQSPRRQRLRTLFAMAIVLLGVATFAEYICALDFGIDRMLFRESVHSPLARAGRMSAATAASFARRRFPRRSRVGKNSIPSYCETSASAGRSNSCNSSPPA